MQNAEPLRGSISRGWCNPQTHTFLACLCWCIWMQNCAVFFFFFWSTLKGKIPQQELNKTLFPLLLLLFIFVPGFIVWKAFEVRALNFKQGREWGQAVYLPCRDNQIGFPSPLPLWKVWHAPKWPLWSCEMGKFTNSS